jgi:Cu/Ag efflux protein CusF
MMRAKIGATQMRAKILPLILIATMGASGAFAATTTDGKIKSIDAKTMSITLADGSSYMLPSGFKLDTLKVGEKVAVTWDLKGKVNEASAVKIVS